MASFSPPEHKSEAVFFNTDYETFYFQNISTPPFHRTLTDHLHNLSQGQLPMIGALAEYSREVRTHVRRIQTQHNINNSTGTVSNQHIQMSMQSISSSQSPFPRAVDIEYSTKNISTGSSSILYKTATSSAANSKSSSRSQPRANSSKNAVELDINMIIASKPSLQCLLQIPTAMEQFLCHSNGARYLHELLKMNHMYKTKERAVDCLLAYCVQNSERLSFAHMFINTHSQPVIRWCVHHGNEKHVQCMLVCWLREAVGIHPQAQLLPLVLASWNFAKEIVDRLNEQNLIQFTNILAIEMSQQSGGGMMRHLFNNNVCKLLTHMIDSKRLRCEHWKFLAVALEAELPLFCNHIYCCRVIQAFLRVYGAKLNVNKLFENNGFVHVSISKYGNYVIMRLIEHSDSGNHNESQPDIFADFRGTFVDRVFSVPHLRTMSVSKHGSNVVETCIRVATAQQIANLVMLLVSNQAQILKKLLNDKFAHFVAKTLLHECAAKDYHLCLQHLLYAANTFIVADKTGAKYGSFFVEKCRRFNSSKS